MFCLFLSFFFFFHLVSSCLLVFVSSSSNFRFYFLSLSILFSSCILPPRCSSFLRVPSFSSHQVFFSPFSSSFRSFHILFHDRNPLHLFIFFLVFVLFSSCLHFLLYVPLLSSSLMSPSLFLVAPLPRSFPLTCLLCLISPLRSRLFCSPLPHVFFLSLPVALAACLSSFGRSHLLRITNSC